MYSFDFEGRSMLVFGSSSGIGNGIARAFRDQGGMASDKPAAAGLSCATPSPWDQ
jgi:NAD(P)-dependent dehydrogenase (short-subunit alcohol dehydrogenase family)